MFLGIKMFGVLQKLFLFTILIGNILRRFPMVISLLFLILHLFQWMRIVLRYQGPSLFIVLIFSEIIHRFTDIWVICFSNSSFKCLIILRRTLFLLLCMKFFIEKLRFIILSWPFQQIVHWWILISGFIFHAKYLRSVLNYFSYYFIVILLMLLMCHLLNIFYS